MYWTMSDLPNLPQSLSDGHILEDFISQAICTLIVSMIGIETGSLANPKAKLALMQRTDHRSLKVGLTQSFPGWIPWMDLDRDLVRTALQTIFPRHRN